MSKHHKGLPNSVGSYTKAELGGEDPKAAVKRLDVRAPAEKEAANLKAREKKHKKSE